MHAHKIGIVVGIIIVALLAFFFLSKDTKAPEDNLQGSNSESNLESNAGQWSLNSLLGQAKAQECTFEDISTDSQTAGTVYVGDGKMRSDFTTTQAGKTQNTHMITTATDSFMWIDGEKQGFRMSLANTNANTENKQAVDPEKPVTMSCKSWNTDLAKFQPPGNVEFVDFSSMMQSLPQAPSTGANPSTSTTTPTDLTGICNSLPEPDKSNCLASLQSQQ